MTIPICLSPLKFYDKLSKQSHRKSYAFGQVSPLLVKLHSLPSFQFVLPNSLNIIADKKIKSVTANINNNYSNYIDIDIPANTEFIISVVGGDDIIADNKLNLYAWDDLNERHVMVTGGITFPYSLTDTRPYKIKKIGIERLANGVIGNGEISLSIIVGGKKLFSAFIYDVKTDKQISDNIAQNLIETGFYIDEFDNYNVVIYLGNLPIHDFKYEGNYYIELGFKLSNDSIWKCYSEVFCFTNNTDNCLEIEYWNELNNFNIKGGIVVFPKQFHFKLLLNTEIGKPEYTFEEESTKRLGYTFVESQVSKKIYKFNAIVPEFICDAMRLIRLCDNKIIRSREDEYEAITFEMEPEWQTQGDLASVTCEFETDNVIVNLGGFMPERHTNGDFNGNFNDDFNND